MLLMKRLFLIILAFSLGEIDAQEISSEFYWIGYSKESEKEFGCSIDPVELTITIYSEEKDSLERMRLTDVTKVKFKRNKRQKDCSNCHLGFTSSKVNKSWVTGNYFSYSKTEIDSANIQWYKPKFKSDVLFTATETEQMSFIAGLFLQSGKTDSIKATFYIDDSPEKAKCAFEILQSLGCENVTMQTNMDLTEQRIIIDPRDTLSFEMTKTLIKFLEKEIKIKTRANNG
jgi:hypothetical protein